MKRLLAILLFFLYLIPVIGIQISAHYCGGELAALVIIPSDEHPCACGDSSGMNDDCCHDVNLSFKIKDNHQKAMDKVVSGKSYQFDVIANPTYYIPQSLNKIDAPSLDHFLLDHPDPPAENLYLLHQSFLI